MSTTLTVKILVRAKEKIVNPYNWTQGTTARTADGRPCESTFPDAVQFCALGATESATVELGYARLHSYEANRILQDCIRKPGDWEAPNYISTYNDSHTHSEVLAIFDKAIVAARNDHPWA